MLERSLVIYHRVDFDGILSGCIAKKFLEGNNEKVSILGWNYYDKLPDPERLEADFKYIIMVDISFPPEVMKKLVDLMGQRLVWIDHHHSSIENSKEHGYSEAQGVRVIGTAACELTWSYFFEEPVPLVIQYCGAYDVWNKKRFDWQEETLPIQYALRSEYSLDFAKIYEDITTICQPGDEVARLLIGIGSPILKYLRKTWKGWVKSYGFPVTVAGKYKGICLLSPQGGSACFESVLDDYDIYVVANRKDYDTYTISVYKEGGNLPDFNLADYVNKTYGTGGGHQNAAGFQINLEQFEKLIKNQEI